MSYNARFIKSLFDLAAVLIANAPVEDRVLARYRSRLASLQEEAEAKGLLRPSTPPPEGVSHIAAPEGESVEHYCLDCASKHLGTAKILLREALQWAKKGEPRERILTKVRGAYEELMGAEDDTLATKDQGILKLNTEIRDLRKWFFNSGVLTDVDVNKIAEAYEKVSAVNNDVYNELEARKERLLKLVTHVKENLSKLEEKLKTGEEGA